MFCPENLKNRLTLISSAITVMGIITAANNWTVLFGGNISLSQATGLSSNILSCGQFIF